MSCSVASLSFASSSSSLCTLSTSCWISVSFSSSLSSSLSASRSSTSSSCNFSLPYVWSNFFNSSLAAVSSFLDFCTNSSTALSLSALAALASCALLNCSCRVSSPSLSTATRIFYGHSTDSTATGRLGVTSLCSLSKLPFTCSLTSKHRHGDWTTNNRNYDNTFPPAPLFQPRLIL
eukprot:GHVQ01023565.1.p1 GENE.GHVQ01023565.1~~GHVQ01023565.1.p1  ORF type:complete len:177 (+),score=15.90 GHVQ01023565.1:482-1012(+)